MGPIEVVDEAIEEQPVWFADRAPQAGGKIIYYYKETDAGNLVIKVHFPAGWKKTDKRPCMVFYHGGGWKSGAPDTVAEQFDDACSHFASRGLVTADAQYRGINHHEQRADLCMEDAKSAARWLKAHAAELGIDADRFIGAGGSAGGHLAAALYTTEGFDAPSDDVSVSCKPNILVLFNPALDAYTEKRIARFLSPEDARACSPMQHLDKNMPPSLLMYGTEDEILEEGKAFLGQAKALGLQSELWVAEGQWHGFFNREPWKSATIRLAEAFLETHGYLCGPPTTDVEPDAQMIQIDVAPDS